jgi:hypothetical protein
MAFLLSGRWSPMIRIFRHQGAYTQGGGDLADAGYDENVT